MVVAELALTVVLLAGAGFMMRNFVTLYRLDLGIDTSMVTEQDDVGYINQILASDADDATKKAELEKLLEAK